MSLTALISSGNFGSMKWPLSSYLCSSASRLVATFKRLAGGFGEDDDENGDDNHLILLGPWQERVVCWPKEQDLPRIFFHLFIWVKDATRILKRQSNLLPLPGLVKITTGLLSGVTKVRAVRPNQDQSCNLQSSQVLKEVWEDQLIIRDLVGFGKSDSSTSPTWVTNHNCVLVDCQLVPHEWQPDGAETLHKA